MTNREEKKKMAAKTISIVRSDLSLSEVVRDLIKQAYAWAERNQGNKQDAQAVERTLRNKLRSVVRHLKGRFSDHQHLSGGSESFPWDQELQQAIEAILEVFCQRFFNIRKHYPNSRCLPENVLANLRDGLEEACRRLPKKAGKISLKTRKERK